MVDQDVPKVFPWAEARDVLASLEVSRVPPSASNCQQYLLIP